MRSHGSQHPIGYPFGGGGVELWARAAGSGGTGGHPQSKAKVVLRSTVEPHSQLALRRLSSAPPAHTVLQANLYRSTDRTHKLRPASTYPATGLGPIRPWDR